MTHLANIDKDYAFWIERLSQRYKQSQIKAATHVNSEMLQFYWSLGRDIVMLHAESRWGDKFVKTLSADLRAKLPGVKGLSETSIGYAKRFYLLYSKCCVIHPQLGGELVNDITEPAPAPQAVGEFQDSISLFGLCFPFVSKTTLTIIGILTNKYAYLNNVSSI